MPLRLSLAFVLLTGSAFAMRNARRIESELTELRKNDAGIFFKSYDQVEQKVVMTIVAPAGTPHAGGVFDIQMVIPDDYPMKWPQSVMFTSQQKSVAPMDHPNIHRDGKVCVDMLTQPGWSPALTMKKVLISIRSMFDERSYNLSDPANRGARDLYKQNHQQYLVAAQRSVSVSQKAAQEGTGGSMLALTFAFSQCEEDLPPVPSARDDARGSNDDDRLSEVGSDHSDRMDGVCSSEQCSCCVM